MTDKTSAAPPFQLADIAVAFSLLSRLPVPLPDDHASNRTAQAVWAYPIVGAVLAFIAGAGALALWKIGVASGAVAGLCLLFLALLTGALHEDGLADSADGLFGARSKDRALEIMRDSRVGAYGVLALFSICLIRWASLETLISGPSFLLTLIAAHMMSRAIMGLAMAILPPAREDGLSAMTGTASMTTAFAGLTLALIAGLFAIGWSAVFLLLAGLATASLLWRFAQRKLNGQTGDILGATQILSETAILTFATALIA